MPPPAMPSRVVRVTSRQRPVPPKTGPITGIASVRPATRRRDQVGRVKYYLRRAACRISKADVAGITKQVSSADHPEYIGLLILVRVARDKPTKPSIEAPQKSMFPAILI